MFNMRIPKTEEEIKQLANDIKENKVFLECYLPNPALSTIVFLPLGYLSDPGILEAKGAFLLYQYLSESVSSYMNFPIFPSMLWLNKEETILLRNHLGSLMGVTFDKNGDQENGNN